jgi:hypothetical protein
MTWLADTFARRADPKALWPEARTVIALGVNYGPAEDPRALQDRIDRGAISVYARNRDYHDVVKKRVKRLARWIAETRGGEVKVFVDTAPVMEKPLAQRAGIGWHHAGTAAGCAGDRPLRQLQPLCRGLPHRRPGRTLSHERQALHLICDHRA